MTGKPLRHAAPRSVRANRLLALSGVLGGVVGLVVAVAAPHSAEHASFTARLPAWLAILLALVLGIGVPLISWRWERTVDEHEREAYRDGAVAGFYVLSVAGPVWWVLWRGGLAPAPDMYWLYGATLFASGVVWLWRKYA